MSAHTKPGDLRKGDTIRITDQWTEVVNSVRDDGMVMVGEGDRGYWINPNANRSFTRTIELLDRPKPEPKLGSVWVDSEAPESDTVKEWVAIRHGRYVSSGGAILLNPERDAEKIARFVPAEGKA